MTIRQRLTRLEREANKALAPAATGARERLREYLDAIAARMPAVADEDRPTGKSARELLDEALNRKSS